MSAFLATFGISAIVWIAATLVLVDLLRDKTDQVRSQDLIVGAGFLLLVIIPVGAASWIALTGLGIYLLNVGNDSRSRWRAAILLVAITMPMFWGRLLFNFFSNFFLSLDAALVAMILGTPRLGTMVGMVNGTDVLVILPPCSSFANMSLAFLCWLTISVTVGHAWSAKDFFVGVLICLSVMVVNVTRLSLMGLSIWHYKTIHSDTGEMVTNLIMLTITIGLSLMGVRRELLARV